MQAQHAEQLSAMKESNERALNMATQAMQTMATQMTQFCAANAIRESGDKENTNPNSGGGGTNQGSGAEERMRSSMHERTNRGSRRKSFAPTANAWFTTNQRNVWSWRPTNRSEWTVGGHVSADRERGQIWW